MLQLRPGRGNTGKLFQPVVGSILLFELFKLRLSGHNSVLDFPRPSASRVSSSASVGLRKGLTHLPSVSVQAEDTLIDAIAPMVALVATGDTLRRHDSRSILKKRPCAGTGAGINVGL